jgi:hypothetical protein
MERSAVGGVPVKHVARHHQVSYPALRRHLSGHLPQAVLRAEEDAEHARAGDLLAQARYLREQAGEILAAARRRDDDRTALLAIREGARCVELEAKLTGELVERQAVDVRERTLLASPTFQLTPEERRVLGPIKRRLLLSGAPGYVDFEDVEWEEVGIRPADRDPDARGEDGGGAPRE